MQSDEWRVMSCSLQQGPWQRCSGAETQEECYVIIPRASLLGEKSLHRLV